MTRTERIEHLRSALQRAEQYGAELLANHHPADFACKLNAEAVAALRDDLRRAEASANYGTLCDSETGDRLRPATETEAWASADSATGHIETLEGRCYVEGGAIVDAVDYLATIDSETWDRTCGDQGRTEFARLALDFGETIEDAWHNALAHAATL